MASVVCCATMEVRYRKRGGGCKVVSDQAVQVSETDAHLNEIMRKTNFKEFISVKITNIHQRPLQSADDPNSSDDEEAADVENEEVVVHEVPRSVSPAASVGQ